MVRKLIAWSLGSPLIVLLLALGLVVGGLYAFLHVNVEAYPDPAPAIIEIVAQYPGASAEEVERLVTVPLEITLAGMPGLKYTRSKSLFGLAHLRNQFEYGIDFYAARQEVINRLQFVAQLPAGVSPQISPVSPTGELMRYSIHCPKDIDGLNLYTLNDLKALQDWTLEREFRRVPRIIDVVGFGGTVKRYEIQPDPDRLKQYGITLQQVMDALAKSNANIGGDIVKQGPAAMNLRGIGLLGGGLDPMQQVLSLASAYQATAHLRAEEQRRLREIRQIVITSVNNVPVRINDIVDGGPVGETEDPGRRGVMVSNQTRYGQVALSRRHVDAQGKTVWTDEPDVVQGIVLLRKGEETLPGLKGAKKLVEDLNNPESGRLLPGTDLPLHFDLTHLINVTTETVQENLLLGMTLVTVILLMFLSNVRSALIVAINIPLALLFAFSMLFLRGKSANLLSIGAVDFGIIVDSSVIMVENIYRHISAGEYSELPFKERILRACTEVERGLFFSTAIMVCAFIPLFTMRGPEGQIFGPMADTYAFALGGALVLALTVSPVLCLLFFRRLKRAQDNFLVRWLKRGYLRQLERCLRHRFATLSLFAALFVGTLVWLFALPVLKESYKAEYPWLESLPTLGREFMPELEEGNLYIRGTFPVNINLDDAVAKAQIAREIMRGYDEVELIQSQVGRPDDGTDPTGFYNVEFTVPLKPEREWPKVKDVEGWRRWFRGKRARTKNELIDEMRTQLTRSLIGVDWNFSQYIRDNVMESLSGVKGDNSVKIIGPDLDKLEELADQVAAKLGQIPGVTDVGVFRIKGQANLEMGVNRRACERWGIPVMDVENVIDVVRGKPVTQMTEGEKTFDITVRWPQRLRNSEYAILQIPVDVSNNTVTSGLVASSSQTPLSAASVGLSAAGTSLAGPALLGTAVNATINNLTNAPRLPLRQLVTPVGQDGSPDPRGSYVRPGASTIYREQGKRLIAVKFSVRGRDLAGAVSDAQEATKDLMPKGYRTEWSGEFQEMEEAEARLKVIIPLSLGLIFIMLYLAFRSLVDAVLVLSNVLALSLGGVWALLLTDTNFSISAAVGFISIFGVAIMDGLLSVSYFNRLRVEGLSLKDAIMQGAEKRVRPMMMTALTAIFGLLPAAVSTRIGSQTQRPLAIVVVGGMIMTLLLNRYLMPVLYSFYGHREPPTGASNLAH
jgi:cobalt-zinc-cadmium resistance protein CzcA